MLLEARWFDLEINLTHFHKNLSECFELQESSVGDYSKERQETSQTKSASVIS